MRVRRRVVVFDAGNIAEESRFWAGLLGGEVHPDEGWHSVVVDGEWTIGVQAAPDHVPPDWPAGPQQQQVHLDLHVDDLEEAHEFALASTDSRTGRRSSGPSSSSRSSVSELEPATLDERRARLVLDLASLILLE